MINRFLNMSIVYQSGLTLIELIMAILIVGVLSAVAIPGYQAYVDRTETTLCVSCIRQIEIDIDRFYIEQKRLPDSLDEVAIGECRTDPWGNPFRYLRLLGKKGKGGNRKDRNENPLNTDYDLYSMGRDGQTNESLRPPVSHDDIIRARNGAFIGLAFDY